MTTLTVTAKGQVTLRKELLKHLGIKPGDKIDVDVQPGGTLTVRPAKRTGSIENFFGCLESGSDFADGVIAFESQRLGGDTFVTFDRKAARQLSAAGAAVELLQPAN